MTSRSDVELEEGFWTDVELKTPPGQWFCIQSFCSPTLNSPLVNSLESAGAVIALHFLAMCWWSCCFVMKHMRPASNLQQQLWVWSVWTLKRPGMLWWVRRGMRFCPWVMMCPHFTQGQSVHTHTQTSLGYGLVPDQDFYWQHCQFTGQKENPEIRADTFLEGWCAICCHGSWVCAVLLYFNLLSLVEKNKIKYTFLLAAYV